MNKLLIIAIAISTVMMASAPRSVAAEDGKGTLLVTAVGFKSSQGQAVVAVYRQGKGWLDLAKAFRIEKVPLDKLKDGSLRITFRDLPHGEYAVTVLHDQNGNGRMDMRWLPYPKPEEPGGASNNFIRSGKPEYSKAKFDFHRALMSVRISLY